MVSSNYSNEKLEKQILFQHLFQWILSGWGFIFSQYLMPGHLGYNETSQTYLQGDPTELK